MDFYKQQSFYSDHLDSYIEMLQKGDLSYIPLIFCVFAECSAEQKWKAAHGLCERLQSFSSDDMCRADIRMRETTSMVWRIDWRRLRVEHFITLQMSEEEQRAVLVFASFHPNGYIREQAVQLLRFYDHTLPFLLLRANDWVTPVREAAFTALSEKIKAASEEEIIEALPLVEKLRKKKRWEYDGIRSIIVSRMNCQLAEKGLESKDIRARRFCIFFLSESAAANGTALWNHLSNEKDPFLRRMVFQLLLQGNADPNRLCKQLLQDKYPPNRVLALQTLCHAKSYLAFHAAEIMVFDKNAQVRSIARRMVSQKDQTIDFRQIYLDHLSASTSVSLLGLGETGSREDCPLIASYLADDRISVIRAAMVVLMRLDPGTFLPHITELLSSEHPGIVKTAALLIRKCGGCQYERVFEILKNTASENTKEKCALLLFSAPKWKALIYMLTLIGSDFENLERLCQRHINSWIFSYNRSFAMATEEEKRIISRLIAEKSRFLSPQIEKQLLFYSR